MIQLTSKYQPKAIKDFAGLARAKAIMSAVVRRPYASAWFYLGDSGTGKSTLALAFAAELGCTPERMNLLHIPAAECTVDRMRDVADIVRGMPMFGNFFVVLIDEANMMSGAAQGKLYSMLDATAMPDNVIWIFTGNTAKGLSDAFLSRVRTIEFDGQCGKLDAMTFLYRVWYAEAGHEVPVPKLAFGDKINMRSHLNAIEMELLCVECAA